MDEVKDKGKVMMRKLNNLFSSPAKFKGEGQRLGTASDASPSGSKAGNCDAHGRNWNKDGRQQQEERRRLQQERWQIEKKASKLQPGSDVDGGQNWQIPVSRPQIRDAAIDYAGSDASKQQNPVNGSQRTDYVAADFADSDVNGRHFLANLSWGSDTVSDSAHTISNRQQNPVLPGTVPETTKVQASEHDSRDDTTKIIREAMQAQNCGHDISIATASNTSGNIDRSFDPFVPCIGSQKLTSKNAPVFECPICKKQWNSEMEVSSHIDDCLGSSDLKSKVNQEVPQQNQTQVESAIGVFLAGGPSSETVSVLNRLLRNLLNDPTTEKYRRIRMGNPKIHETIGTALGGVEFLESLGFYLKAEGDEVWATIDLPSAGQISIIKDVIAKLDEQLSQPIASIVSGLAQENQERNVIRKVDRKLRVFHAAPENLASKIELPDSFFELSAAEVREEAFSRKKKLEESQQLISKALKEKQATANKRRYKYCIIRIQFPDGVILQGLFQACELTTALYEFVSLALEDNGLEFDLVFIASRNNPVIPCVGEATRTLEEANLVPTALIKLKPAENVQNVCAWLRSDLLQLSEPLTSVALPK